MFACCHFGSSIDAAGACHRHRSQIAASANYQSGRHIACAMGKRAGQAAVLKRPAAKMCSQPRASSGVGANNGFLEDAQGLASGEPEVQQEVRRSGFAVDVGRSSCAGASSLSAATACGPEAGRTTTAPGHASAGMNADSTAANRRLGVWYRSMRPPTGNLTLPLPCVTCRA